MSPAGCGGAGCPFRSDGGQTVGVCRCFDARAFQDPARRRETAEAVRALVAERNALRATMVDNAAVNALNAIASICGCPDWDYPGQLVRDVEALRTERDRLQRACDEGLPREVIPCPACKAPHVEGPRHDDPTKDGRVRPHHTHRCYGCGHVWDDGRWTFGVAPGGENEVTKRLRAEGRVAGLREAAKASREAYDWFAKSRCDLYAAGAGKCVEAIEALLDAEVSRG